MPNSSLQNKYLLKQQSVKSDSTLPLNPEDEYTDDDDDEEENFEGETVLFDLNLIPPEDQPESEKEKKTDPDFNPISDDDSEEPPRKKRKKGGEKKKGNKK
jgi:hypothetical protein